ncbi:MAG: exo-alpha-sialidase, partial [Lachnospiraceae bacterium]|nr:exo-alpha-sialidase [Lachnospiraceae bacterium]
MKRLAAFLLAFAVSFTSLPNVSFAAEVNVTPKPQDGVTEEQPFMAGTGGSQKFRIPCMVTLDDGTIVAGCDARWTGGSDAGGLDTIVSRSYNNGQTWNYTFANYFGDNGNVYNPASTAFIDPSMATDGKTVYLVADLFPAGYAIAGATNSAAGGQNGLTKEGYLRLASFEAADTDNNDTISHAERIATTLDYDAYHLEKKSENVADDAEDYYVIKDKEGNILDEYKVDAFFNIKGENLDTNIFLADSPFLTFPTDYLYFTKSDDAGATWSIPTLINLKEVNEEVLLVGPGNGIVTSSGRIIFTGYNKVGSALRSTMMYSDDKGKTWHRSENIPYSSSEATVAEVGDKLYMFTRLQQAYYVSEDEGKTWVKDETTGQVKKFLTNLGHCHDTQLSVIAYSKEIDGKPAVLLSAPSIYRRKSGKIYVGLVEGDGTITWPEKYRYSVNGTNEEFAYSCIAELEDGSIGLLFEDAFTSIKYRNIPIEEIAKGSDIAPWLVNSENQVVSRMDLRSNGSTTLQIKAPSEDSNITVTSSNEEYLTVRNENGVVTITAKDVGNGLVQAEILVSDGTKTTVIPVNIVGTENYEVVELAVDGEATYVDDSGYYVETETDSISSLVETTMTGVEPTAKIAKLELATTATSFGGSTINFSDALFTFNSVSENSYHIVAKTSNDDNVELSLKEVGKPTVALGEEQSEITVSYNSTSQKWGFSASDNSLSISGNDSENPYFTIGTSGTSYDFEIYEASQEASQEFFIPGYRKVTEIADDGKYLITFKKGDNTYVLYPSTGSNNYEYIAKVSEVYDIYSGMGVQLASAEAQFDVPRLQALSNALYTFSAPVDGKYEITSVTKDGEKVFLNVKSGAAGIPSLKNVTSAIEIQESGADTSKFSIKDVSVANDTTHLYFHRDANGNKLRFDRTGTVDT